MSKIDVIIPVYNVEKYLGKCIDSIVGQTFRDFQLLLVDDGSTDKSGEICDRYAERYGFIRVIHKANGGASDARNRGLEESDSEYIAFLDADDYIDARYLEVLYGILSRHRADLAICDIRNVLDEQAGQGKAPRKAMAGASRKGKSVKGAPADAGQRAWAEQAKKEAEVISKAEAYRRMLVGDGMSVSPCAKLYHRKLFEGVRYPVGEISEDAYVINRIVENSSRIVCTRYAGYFYVRRKGSAWHQGMTPMHKAAVRNAKRLWDFMKEKYPEVEDAAKVFYLNNCIQLINFMVVGSGNAYEKDCRKLRRKVVREWRFFLRSRDTSLVEKGAMVCLLPGIPFYRLAWRGYLWLTGKASGTMT